MTIHDLIKSSEDPQHPLFFLSAEDLNMIMAFILESGSIKALAKKYSVSYPTMRQRLDALIKRVRQLAENSAPDPLSNHLADLINRGRLTTEEARHLRELHRSILNRHQQNQANS